MTPILLAQQYLKNACLRLQWFIESKYNTIYNESLSTKGWFSILALGRFVPTKGYRVGGVCSSLKPEFLFAKSQLPWAKDEKTKALQVAEEAADIYKDDDWVVISCLLMFIPIWGRFPFWLLFFKWVETTNQMNSAHRIFSGSADRL